MRKRLLTSDRRALVLHLLLALSLMIAQTAAQAHVYSHLKSGSSKSDFSGTAGQLCSECLSSAPLLSAAGSPDSPRLTRVTEVTEAVAMPAAPRVESSPLHAFRSRAPPELL